MDTFSEVMAVYRLIHIIKFHLIILELFCYSVIIITRVRNRINVQSEFREVDIVYRLIYNSSHNKIQVNM